MARAHASARRRRYAERDHDVATRSTEPYELHTFRVHLQADQWDSDSLRFEVDVRALGEHDARNQVRLDYPHAGLRRVERLD